MKIMNFFKYILIRLFGMEVIVKTYVQKERRFYCKSRVEYFRTAQYGDERDFLVEFMEHLNPNDVLWDIGASIGIVSVYAASNLKKVYAFEPDVNIFNRLNNNIELNKLQSKIETFNFGIGKESTKMTLFSDGIDGKSPSIENLGRHTKQYEITIKSIDEIIENGADIPTVIKIDIEGAEMLALHGAEKLFSSLNKPRLLFIEIHPLFLESFKTSKEEIFEFLERYNYKLSKCVERAEQIHVIAKLD